MASSPPNLTGDTVSQSEIERLLAQVGSGDAVATEGTGSADNANSGDAIQKHEFPALSLFSASELRTLRLRHEDYVVSLGARLSIHLGMETGIQLAKFETIPFSAFVDSLANPSHVTIVRLEPLGGVCVFDIPLRLALALVDRELGGAGVWREEPRELTKMETRLLDRILMNILTEWCGVWREFFDLRPVLLGVENNSRFLHICPPETVNLVVSIGTKIAQVADTMQLALPYQTLEPLLAKLNSATEKSQKPATPVRPAAAKWNGALEEMEMKLTAELPALDFDAGRLADLKPGDLIDIPAGMASRVKLFFAGTPKFVGILGSQAGQWAVRISETTRPPAHY